MKTIKTTLLVLGLLLTASFFVQAKEDNKPEMTCKYVLTQYIQCTTKGNVDGINQLLDENFKVCVPLKGKTNIFSKKQMVAFLKTTEGFVQNCTTDYSFVELNDKVGIAKVEMKYPTFTLINYITLNNMGDGWKITHASSSYK